MINSHKVKIRKKDEVGSQGITFLTGVLLLSQLFRFFVTHCIHVSGNFEKPQSLNGLGWKGP